MVFYPSENNPSSLGGNNLNLPAFDLQAEKQRIGEGTEEIRQELLITWQRKYSKTQIFPAKISSINPELIEFLLSFKNTLFYNDLAKKFGFSAEQRDFLPQIIWKIGLAKNWYGLEALLQSEMKMNSSVAGQITILVNQNILFRAKELGEKVLLPKRFGDEKVDSGLESIPIQVALKKYPELGEQLITSERIALQSFPGPVRPSIKNWLAAYNFVMGYDRERSAIERTAYLFHNPNTKKLNLSEREKVSSLLRSYDENYPLTINKNTQQVVFPPMVPKTAPIPTSLDRLPASPTRQPYGSPGDGRNDTGKSTPAPNHFTQPTPKQAFPESARPIFQTPPESRPPAPTPTAKPEIKEPPLVPKKEPPDVRFTSSHTLPFEKDSQGPLQPHRIIPMGLTSQEGRPEEASQPVKNVINLKE